MLTKNINRVPIRSFFILPATFLVYQTSIAEQKVVFEKLYKPRLIVLTDIENEPDDAMSMVRLMTYANVLDIEGLATISCWQPNAIADRRIHEIVDAYGKVRYNLLKHEPGYLSLQHIEGLVKKGIPAPSLIKTVGYLSKTA